MFASDEETVVVERAQTKVAAPKQSSQNDTETSANNRQ